MAGGRQNHGARTEAETGRRGGGDGSMALVLPQDTLQTPLHSFVQLLLQLLLLGHGQLRLVIPHHLIDVWGTLGAV